MISAGNQSLNKFDFCLYYFNNMALFLMNKKVYALGNNSLNMFGLGHDNDLAIPTEVPGLPEIRKIYNFKTCSVLIDVDNYMWVCGSHFYHPLYPQIETSHYVGVFYKSIGNVRKVIDNGGLYVLCNNNILYENGHTRKTDNHPFYEFIQLCSDVDDIKIIGNCLFLIRKGQMFARSGCVITKLDISDISDLTKRSETYAKFARANTKTN
jgi:hypothetical protein